MMETDANTVSFVVIGSLARTYSSHTSPLVNRFFWAVDASKENSILNDAVLPPLLAITPDWSFVGRFWCGNVWGALKLPFNS